MWRFRISEKKHEKMNIWCSSLGNVKHVSYDPVDKFNFFYSVDNSRAILNRFTDTCGYGNLNDGTAVFRNFCSCVFFRNIFV